VVADTFLCDTFSSCRTFGKTPEAAVHEIGDAIEAWIAACRASGDPVPELTAKARQAA
jgi:predicted RNase H-like HicB family nuclease